MALMISPSTAPRLHHAAAHVATILFTDLSNPVWDEYERASGIIICRRRLPSDVCVSEQTGGGGEEEEGGIFGVCERRVEVRKRRMVQRAGDERKSGVRVRLGSEGGVCCVLWCGVFWLCFVGGTDSRGSAFFTKRGIPSRLL
ncbi:hypothetical protein JZ751_026939 [Albula glossodonta]|uniref:Uncharacterized protein n=1 Tax=Albula glossodonta TaxID=121402 RepID=A0A8T2ND33_9TELE|nr:hypothetical protein JZ751_026939 [Albula glossodonta]